MVYVVHVLASNTNILLNSTAVLYIIVGILADIRLGRYKVVAYSIFISFALLLASSAASLISNLSEAAGLVQHWLPWIAICAYIAHFIALMFFQGTILQFGLDQLSEASSDELSSFIHCAGMLILCLALCRGARGCNIQFIREPPSRSPYTSVFKSISFSRAFVLHFGREQQSSYTLQPKDLIDLITAHVFYSPIFATALLIPLHELVLHPLLGNRYLPSMMTKMKIAGILISASLAINLIIDGVGHYRQNVQCIFAAYTSATPLPGQLQAIDISPFILIVPGLMVDLAVPLLYISFLEFTVAQAPYPMRGMIIGFAYFFVGLFTILGAGYQWIFMSLASLSSSQLLLHVLHHWSHCFPPRYCTHILDNSQIQVSGKE
ncbi:hypothetical protein EMCRGX_G006543 [Ephydatia muelleri]